MANTLGSAWAKLKTLRLKEVTQTNIGDSVKESFISEKAYLQKVITLHQAKEASSCFGGGGVVPSTGSIQTEPFTNTAATIQPAEGEVWTINPELLKATNASVNNVVVTISIRDNDNILTFPTVALLAGASKFVIGADSSAPMVSPIMLTNSLYMTIEADSDNICTYHLPIVMEAI